LRGGILTGTGKP